MIVLGIFSQMLRILEKCPVCEGVYRFVEYNQDITKTAR